jgi:hypothetical protein
VAQVTDKDQSVVVEAEDGGHTGHALILQVKSIAPPKGKTKLYPTATRPLPPGIPSTPMEGIHMASLL